MVKQVFWKIKSDEEINLLTDEQVTKLDDFNLAEILWNIDLDELQQAIEYINLNLDTLQNLSIDWIAWLRDALNQLEEWLTNVKAKTDKITVTWNVNLDTLLTDVNTLKTNVDNLDLSTINDDVAWIKAKTDKITVTDNVNLDNMQTAIETLSTTVNNLDLEAVNTALEWKADKSTTYTKTETDTLLNAKANTSDINTTLEWKADKSTTYTKTETDNLLNAKANTSDIPDTTNLATKSELPTKTSDLTNDSWFVTNDWVQDIILEELNQFDKLDYEVVTTLPTTWETWKRYLVKVEWEDKYNEYIYTNNTWNNIWSTWSVNLDNYYNKTEVDTKLDTKLTKINNKDYLRISSDNSNIVARDSNIWTYPWIIEAYSNYTDSSIWKFKQEYDSSSNYRAGTVFWYNYFTYSDRLYLNNNNWAVTTWTNSVNTLWTFTIDSKYWNAKFYWLSFALTNMNNSFNYKIKFQLINTDTNETVWESLEETIPYYLNELRTEEKNKIVSDWKQNDVKSAIDATSDLFISALQEWNVYISNYPISIAIDLIPWNYKVNLINITNWTSNKLYINRIYFYAFSNNEVYTYNSNISNKYWALIKTDWNTRYFIKDWFIDNNNIYLENYQNIKFYVNKYSYWKRFMPIKFWKYIYLDNIVNQNYWSSSNSIWYGIDNNSNNYYFDTFIKMLWVFCINSINSLNELDCIDIVPFTERDDNYTRRLKNVVITFPRI